MATTKSHDSAKCMEYSCAIVYSISAPGKTGYLVWYKIPRDRELPTPTMFFLRFLAATSLQASF